MGMDWDDRGSYRRVYTDEVEEVFLGRK
jgi:hypothetical protein